MSAQTPIDSNAVFCSACGNKLVATAVICPKCGSPRAGSVNVSGVRPPKSKTTAVVLAVFLSYWTWLYTYQKDTWKFWTGLGLGILGSILTFTTGFGVFIHLGIGVWAIIDAAVKPRSYYENYPNG